MRLFLHGRYDARMLVDRIKQAEAKDVRETFADTASSTSSLRYYSSLLLSNWNMDEMDAEVVDALKKFLRNPRFDEEEVSHQEEGREEQEDERARPEISKTSSFVFSQTSLTDELSSTSSILTLPPTFTREVVLQNCEGGERLEELIELLMETNTSLVIRYDKQRSLPTHVAKGLLRGAELGQNSCDRCELPSPVSLGGLRSLALKGATLTPLEVTYLRLALPLLPNLETLTIRGNFALFELDRLTTSIVGNDPSNMVKMVESLHQMLLKLPKLRHLDLQQCHLPDELLSDLLDALCPESIVSLNLNGNIAHDESQHVLHRMLSHTHCQLRHLDLSWQRLPYARSNRSILDIGVLVSTVHRGNTSLETLNLSENRLLDQDIAYLSRALVGHPSLRKVSLHDCNIGDEGMLALAYELRRWPEHLTHVHIDGRQRIRSPSRVRKAIFHAVLKNVFLEELALPSELESDSTSWALELNKAGRRALTLGIFPKERLPDCPDPAIECTLYTPVPSFDSQTGTNQMCDALWPKVLERADCVARRETNREKDSINKAASAMYLLLREKAFHSVIRA